MIKNKANRRRFGLSAAKTIGGAKRRKLTELSGVIAEKGMKRLFRRL
jgi:hypothetical protein